VSAYALCIDEANRILLCRIAPGFMSDPGYWTIPGGGVDFGEPPIDAARRELEEVTGLIGEVGELVEVLSWHGRWIHPRDSVDEEYHGLQVIYRARIIGGELRNEREGSTDLAAWHTRQEAEALPLVELAQVALRLAYG